MAVLKLPGSITITRTPNGSSSRRRLSEMASRANLDAAYGPMNGNAPRPAIELMLTIRPRETLRSGKNACVTARAPIRFTSKARRSSSSGNSSSGPAAGIPALFTSPSSGAPASARSTCSLARAMLAVSVTSIRTTVTPSRANATSSSARRTVPNTRKPRPARCRAMAAPKPVEAPVTTTPRFTPGNLRPPRQGRRARPQRRVDVAQRDASRDGPLAPLRGRDADRRHLAVRSQFDDGRRGVIRTLVGLDHQGPRPLLGPGTLQSVDALSRGLGEVELERSPLAGHHPRGGAGHDEPHRRTMMERVDQQERVACGLVVRVDGQLDRDPGRALHPEGRGREEHACERREREATNPGLHGNLQWSVAVEMPPRVKRLVEVGGGGWRWVKVRGSPSLTFTTFTILHHPPLRSGGDPVDAAARRQHVQLAGRVLAEREHIAETHVQAPRGRSGDGAVRVGKAPHPAGAVVGVEVLPDQRRRARAAVDKAAGDRAAV